MTGGCQCSERGERICSAPRYSAAARLARWILSPSALLTAIMSASSTRPFLMPCNSSPAPGSISARKKSVMSQTAVSDCPMPTVSTSTTSKEAASHKRPGGGRGRDIGTVGGRKPRHPRLVAEDRATGAGGGGIHRKDRDLVATFDQEHPESVDGGGFADPGRAGNADANRVAGLCQQRLHQLARRGLMIASPAFDQRDRPRQRRAVAGAEVFCQCVDVEGQIVRQVHALVYNGGA